MIETFFKHLAKRLKSENDLSDITWALAKTNTSFLESFMGSFSFRGFVPGKPLDIMREITFKDSRPDFLVIQGARTFLIENKIWDRQHHFEQYAETYPDAERGFISAYKLNSIEESQAMKYGFSYLTWSSMADLLQEKINDNLLNNSKEIMVAYINFVKEVCGIMDLKQLRLEDGPLMIHAFTRLAAWVIVEGFRKDGLTCIKYNNDRRAYGDFWAGQYAELSYSEDSNPIYPLLGLEYNIDKGYSAIVVWVEKDWNPQLYDRYGDMGYDSDVFEYYKDTEDECLEFKLKNEMFTKLFAVDLESQKSILLMFFNKVVNDIMSHAQS